MRRLLPWLRLLAAGLASIGFGALVVAPVRAQDLSDGSGYTVAGTVLNEATGQPIGRARVILDNQQAQLTASDGSFSFEHIGAGSYLLSVDKPGYQGFGGPGMGGAGYGGGGFHPIGRRSSPNPPRRIVVGPEMPSLVFRLTPLASISGHLTLSTSDPASQIYVNLFGRQYQNGRSRWALAGQATTRSDGSWRLANLAPGRYLILTSASMDGPNDPANSLVPVFGFPALYYPGVTDIGSAGVLVLRAGQQAQADMTLVRQRFFPVTITVHGVPATPTSFEIVDSGGRSTGLPVRYDFRSGIGHANVPSGSWTLVSRAFGEMIRFGSTDFQVAGAPVSLSVTVAPLPSVPVILHRDFSASADGSAPPMPGPGLSLFLESADESSAGGSLEMVPNRQDGDAPQYEVKIFEPGKVWALTANSPGMYVASVTSGGADLATTPLMIVPGNQPAPIEVTLRNDPGTIAGKVDLSSPGTANGSGEQTQVWIYAIPLFPTTGNLPQTSLQDNGQFHFATLAPGSYRVVACDAPQEIEFHTQEALAAWSGRGRVVTVDPNGTANVELTVIHGDAE